MSLLDKATIITTPTAHGNGVLHSIKGGAVADFDVVRGSAATRVNAEGLIEDAAANIPRIDYTDGTASVLLEPQSANLLEYSEDFISGNWAVDDVTILSDLSISPSGESNSSIVAANTIASRHNIKRAKAGVNTAALSIFAKAKELSYIQIASANSPQQFANFDLSNGTVGSVGSGFSNAKIEDYGNGWYRCSVVSDNQYSQAIFSLVTSPTSSWLETWTSSNNTDGLYIWGAQLEELPYATSYIPTNGAIATRLADSVTGAGSADLINSTEGVLYFEGKRLSLLGSKRTISISDGSLNNYLYIQFQGVSNTIRIFYKTIENGTTVLLNHPLTSPIEFGKYAFKWSDANFSLWVNGAKELEQLSGGTTSSNVFNQVDFSLSNGADEFIGKVKSVITFDTALTDEELTCLTTI